MSSSSPKPYDVICVGIIVADNVCAPITKIPPAGSLITTRGLTLSIGGCAANVGVDLAKLEQKVSLVGRVGDDVFGKYVLNELESHGVCCDNATVSQTAQTSATMVVNVQGEDRRFIHAVGANAELSGKEVSADLLRSARAVYVGGFGLNPALSGENVRDLFKQARELSVITILDVVLDDPAEAMKMLQVALPMTDYFLPNTDEAELMTGLRDPRAQAARFIEAGAKTVVITQGSEGALVHDREQGVLRIPGYRVEQVDGTGGGDAFAAGFIYGLLQGKTLEECLTYGSALGASCVQAPGATTGVFNRTQIEDYVQANPMKAFAET